MESVIGELFEMSGVSRVDGQARAVRFAFVFALVSGLNVVLVFFPIFSLSLSLPFSLSSALYLSLSLPLYLPLSLLLPVSLPLSFPPLCLCPCLCHCFCLFLCLCPCYSFMSFSLPQLNICSIFGKLDINGDGELDEVEFIGGCLDDSELVRLLNGSKVGETNINQANPQWLQSRIEKKQNLGKKLDLSLMAPK